MVLKSMSFTASLAKFPSSYKSHLTSVLSAILLLDVSKTETLHGSHTRFRGRPQRSTTRPNSGRSVHF